MSRSPSFCTRLPRSGRFALALALTSAFALGALGGLAACGHPGMAPRGATQVQGPPPTRGTTKAKDELKEQVAWKDELRNLRSIPQLWDALNRHQDRLGRSLALLARPREYRVTVDVPPRPGTPHPPPPPRRATRPAKSPPDTRALGHRYGGGLCQRACQHVAAICYAATRICRIASRLGDWAAQQACSRATDRCREARATARGRCPRCPAG